MELVDVGARLNVVVTGDGPPIVLCHGGPGVHDYLETLAAILPARVHRFEQRGCGLSEDKEPNTIAALLEDIESLRQHWKLEQFTMAGHSWGAALALLYTLEHPERVSNLLYFCGLGIETGWEDEHAQTTQRRLGPEKQARLEAIRVELEDASPELARRLAGEMFDVAMSVESDDPRLPTFKERGVRPDLYRRLDAEWKALTRDPSLKERVSRCRTPALLVQGGNDCRPNWPARNLAESLRDSRYVEIEGAGHFPWLDDEKAFLGAVRGFVAS